jgi:hypothetical protein
MTDGRGSAHTNFFLRFWRGEYSLPISYWVVSFLGNVIVITVIGVMAAAFQVADFNPYLWAGYIVLLWLLVAGWGVIHLVGVWRSATRYQQEKRSQNKSPVWGILAQIALIIGAINLVSQVVKDGVPQLREIGGVAFENDPSVPDYAIRVMRNGTELEIAGGFKYGLADDVAKLMRDSPQVKVVHLNSVGGRLGEAKTLARLIRTKGLTTYTSSRCVSACTIAFGAGRERWIKAGGDRLGFHRGSFAGQEVSDAMRMALLEEGYERAFVDLAVSYPSDKMWYPSVSELQATHVISGEVDNYKFAASGHGFRPGTDDVVVAMRKNPLYRAMEQVDAGAFAKFASQYERRYVEGVPEGTILDDAYDQLLDPLVRSRRPLADSQILIDYARLFADQYQAIGVVDAEACYAYSVRGESEKALRLLSPELKQRERDLIERVLATPPARTTAPNDQEVEALGHKVNERLVARYGEADVRLLRDSEKVGPSQYPSFCRVAVAMFREIAQLPAAEAGTMMSAVFKELSQDSK